MLFYNDLLFCECVQVVATVDDSNPLDKEVPPRSDGLHSILADYINQKSGKLALCADEKQVCR